MEMFGWETGSSCIKPKMEKALQHMREVGVERVGGIGFCWGGWALLYAANMPKDPSRADLICCAVAHPSCHRPGTPEAIANAISLAKTAQCPMLMMPASNDPDIYDPAKGTFMAALKEKNPSSYSIPFPDMFHGWAVRGDMQDPKIARDVKICLDETEKFFGKFIHAGAKM